MQKNDARPTLSSVLHIGMPASTVVCFCQSHNYLPTYVPSVGQVSNLYYKVIRGQLYVYTHG